MFGATPLGMIAGSAFSLLLVAAAIGDVRTRRIPNRLVAVVAILGLSYSVVSLPVVPGTLRGLEGLGTGLVCWIPLYLFGWLGAGDVKLFAAAGAWLGPARAIEGTLIAAIVGAVLALVWMLRSNGIRNVVQTLGIATALPGVLTQSQEPARAVRTLPYGVAIAAGAILAAWMPLLMIAVARQGLSAATQLIKG